MSTSPFRRFSRGSIWPRNCAGSVKALACRISRTGAMTMLLDRKVKGEHIRRRLGEFQPGPGGKTIDIFGVDARAELAKIDANPDKWPERDKAEVSAMEITVEDAFDLCLKKKAHRGTLATEDWEYQTRRFIVWLKAGYPRVQLWHKLLPHHIEAYEERIKAGNPAPNTFRLRMQPLIQTGLFMSKTKGLHNPMAAVRTSTKLATEPAVVDMEDVLDLLDWLRENRLWLEAPAALQGLAGLRVLEALRLEWRHVDLEKELVAVGQTEARNPFSRRTLPVPKRALDALKRAVSMRVVAEVEDAGVR